MDEYPHWLHVQQMRACMNAQMNKCVSELPVCLLGIVLGVVTKIQVVMREIEAQRDLMHMNLCPCTPLAFLGIPRKFPLVVFKGTSDTGISCCPVNQS